MTERVQRGAVARSVTTWHDVQPSKPPSSRRSQRQQHDVPAKPKSLSRRAVGVQVSQQPNKKSQRSALRSAANHKARRLRALRRLVLVMLYFIRLRRAAKATSTKRDVPGAASPASPGKRRLAAESLDGGIAQVADAAASPPKPKRAAPSAPPPGLRTGFLLT